MDPREQQEEELQVLESIYPDELEKITDDRFNIHIRLDTEPIRYLSLDVEYPAEYPDVVPVLDVLIKDGTFINGDVDSDEDEDEDEDGDEGESGEYFDTTDIKKLRNAVKESAEENIGMPSIFTVASVLKEVAEEIYASKIKEREQQALQVQREQEEKEQAKFRGTPVTPESFAVWKEKFDAEFKSPLKPAEKGPTKLTGRQIFEQGLNKEDDEDNEGVENEQVEQVTSSVGDLQVDN